MTESPYQIWIAEDNPADVYLIEEALRRHEFTYRLTTADNGEDMLKMIAKLDRDPSESCPDLFLIDLNLPRRSGDEILARLRQSSRCSQFRPLSSLLRIRRRIGPELVNSARPFTSESRRTWRGSWPSVGLFGNSWNHRPTA